MILHNRSGEDASLLLVVVSDGLGGKDVVY